MNRSLNVLAGVVSLVLVVGACTKAAPEPIPTVTETETASAAPTTESPSPTSSDWVVNGCTIAPQTNCKGANLMGEDLRDAQLERSDLNGTNLSQALLHRANLRYASLHKSNLSAANLTAASMEQTVLTGANLSHANLKNASLEGASVTDVVWTHAYLCGTTMPDGTVDNSSCGGSSSPTPSPTPVAVSKVHITELDAQATVKCVQRGRPEIKVFYATKNATSVSFSPEPISWNSNKTSGTALMGFKCPRVHQDKHVSQTYTLTATGADGRTAQESTTVISHASPHLLGSTEGGDDMAGTS